MGHTMVIAVPPADLDRLDAIVAAHQADETRWQANAEQDAQVLDLRGPALRAVRTRIRIERDNHRESGRHRVTRWRALAPALYPELERLGILRDWAPIPEGEQQAGQTLGGTGPHGGRGLTGRLCLTLPDTLAVPLTRGVYWTNQPHVTALQAWADQWGTGPGARRTTTTEALDERAVLAARIITTGQILRTALNHTLQNRP
ncbi:hypothetical protein ACIRP0_24115 [Streptomyces sp. NPDC101733]|uniref:hypothetical protein n=1 Tax=unclassified Streptomyces TaxID=2593676 RepID=UPI00381FA1C7